MRKDDVKAIILIFFILLLISAIAILGIKMYTNIIGQNDNNQETAFQGNSNITPDEDEENKPIVIVQGNGDILNQVVSANGNTQTSKPNGETQTTNPNVVKNTEGYYYKQLSSYSKLIYDKLKNNKDNLKTGTYKIDFGKDFNDLLSQENGSDLLQEYYQSAMETFLYDNPDVFYLDPTKMYINIQTTKKIFTTTYEVFIDKGSNVDYLADGYNSKQQILQYEAKINEEIKKIIDQVDNKCDYEKILCIHDYLVDNVSYDETISRDNIYNMYGTLVNKVAVCEGYAKTFKYLMDQVGIESIVIIGDATDSNGNMQSHAWNYINLNDTWYAIDVTWDDPILIGGGKLSKKNKYQYFLKGSTTMNKDHEEAFTFVQDGKVYEHPILSVRDYE